MIFKILFVTAMASVSQAWKLEEEQNLDFFLTFNVAEFYIRTKADYTLDCYNLIYEDFGKAMQGFLLEGQDENSIEYKNNIPVQCQEIAKNIIECIKDISELMHEFPWKLHNFLETQNYDLAGKYIYECRKKIRPLVEKFKKELSNTRNMDPKDAKVVNYYILQHCDVNLESIKVYNKEFVKCMAIKACPNAPKKTSIIQ